MVDSARSKPTRRPVAAISRPPTRSASPNRRKGEAAGSDLVDSLNTLVDQLIRENRRLRRQLDKISAGGTRVASTTLERGMKNLQKRVEKALAGVTGVTRPKSGVKSATRSGARPAGKSGTRSKRSPATAAKPAVRRTPSPTST